MPAARGNVLAAPSPCCSASSAPSSRGVSTKCSNLMYHRSSSRSIGISGGGGSSAAAARAGISHRNVISPNKLSYHQSAAYSRSCGPSMPFRRAGIARVSLNSTRARLSRRNTHELRNINTFNTCAQHRHRSAIVKAAHIEALISSAFRAARRLPPTARARIGSHCVSAKLRRQSLLRQARPSKAARNRHICAASSRISHLICSYLQSASHVPYKNCGPRR